MGTTDSATSRLQEKLIENAKKEAEEIIRKAEEEARKIIENAEKEYEEKVEKVKEKIISDAKRRAEEIIVDAKIRARMILAEEKKNIVEQVFRRVEEIVKSGRFNRRESLYNLLKESISEIALSNIRVIVSREDEKLVKELKKQLEKELNVKIVEIKVTNSISGGVIVESLDGRIRIDNSYEERLESARSKLAPLIVKEVLGRG